MKERIFFYFFSFIPFSNTISYSTFYAFFSFFRITLWPMWLANSKRQPCFYPPQSHAQEDTQNWQKNWQTWWETCAVPENIQFRFSCSYFYTVKLHSLTSAVWGPLGCMGPCNDFQGRQCRCQPGILHDNLQRESHKPYSPPTSVTWYQPLRQRTNTGTSLRSDCRNTLIYAHTTWRTLPTGDINIGSLKLLALEAGDFVELVLLYLRAAFNVSIRMRTACSEHVNNNIEKSF